MNKVQGYLARTDFASCPISKVVPIPAVGAIITDPDFHSEILRVTGPTFNPDHPGFAFMAGLGGSADVCPWSVDSTLFTFEDNGTRSYVMQFNPKTMVATPLYPNQFPGCTFHTSATLEFSKRKKDLLYQITDTHIQSWDLGNRASMPMPVRIHDFAPDLGFVPLWKSVGGISADGNVFAMAYSAGPQGTGTTIIVYHALRGWRKFDTLTGTVTGTYGPLGTIKSADRFHIHNVKMSPGGRYLVISPVAGQGDKHFWNMDTLEMSVVDNFTGGHFTSGYKTWINNGGIPFGQYQKRLFTSPTLPVSIINPMPNVKQKAVFDAHLSWNNCGPDDADPFFATTTTTNDDWQLWQHEVLGFAGGKVYRFCHTFNTGKSPLFSIANAIGCVSQDGKWLIFCTDWNGQTKGDVFIVALR